ncbi:MAG: HK97 family phage prohead protease [Sphingobium sp.]
MVGRSLEPWVPASAGTRESGNSVRFAGYAALFDREDRGGDIIRRGAFERAIAAWRGRKVPLLWQHRPDAVIGEVEMLEEDARGLRVIGALRMNAPGDAAALLKRGQVNGLSFGYRVTRADGRAPRVLKDLDLVEVSLVTFPMQPGARVHAVE